MIVYFHGGGWVLADINTYDATPRALALGSGAMVISVDYRHAPEHKFPAHHEDAWTAYAWVVENIHTMDGDAKRIAVTGESAGGNLAANGMHRPSPSQRRLQGVWVPDWASRLRDDKRVGYG